MKKETDKRLIIPKDAFEEEASEGLGRLNRDEAEEDLRDLEGRLAKELHDLERGTSRRLRRPVRVWIPAAAAVIIILIASTVYIGLFRDKQPVIPETAMANDTKKDTVMIAMAAPITKVEAEVKAKDEAKDGGGRYVAAVVADEAEIQVEAMVEDEAEAENDDKMRDEILVEILGAGVQAEEVIVQAVPERAKAAEGIPAKVAEGMQAKRADTRTAKNAAVADREKEYKTTGPDHAPQPLGGIDELNTWISNNIRYPAETLTRTRQLVTVSFKVLADSTIYDLRAERTPGAQFTEEAFRLLREGPHWAPAIRNGYPVEETVRVSLLFK